MLFSHRDKLRKNFSEANRYYVVFFFLEDVRLAVIVNGGHFFDRATNSYEIYKLYFIATFPNWQFLNFLLRNLSRIALKAEKINMRLKALLIVFI